MPLLPPVTTATCPAQHPTPESEDFDNFETARTTWSAVVLLEKPSCSVHGVHAVVVVVIVNNLQKCSWHGYGQTTRSRVLLRSLARGVEEDSSDVGVQLCYCVRCFTRSLTRLKHMLREEGLGGSVLSWQRSAAPPNSLLVPTAGADPAREVTHGPASRVRAGEAPPPRR